MGSFPYLWIYENQEDQDSTKAGDQLLQEETTDRDGDLWVENDVIINGESIFDLADKEKQRIKNIFGTAHKLPVGVKPHADWNVEKCDVKLIGTNLYVYFKIKTIKEIKEGNITNIDVFTASVTEYGYIKNAINTSLSNAGSGPVASFYTKNMEFKGQVLNFTVVLTSLGSTIKSGTSLDGRFVIPVGLNYMNFPTEKM